MQENIGRFFKSMSVIALVVAMFFAVSMIGAWLVVCVPLRFQCITGVAFVTTLAVFTAAFRGALMRLTVMIDEWIDPI